ncbi:MAG: MATE family efflux transporter [Clostridia bacterium]|nr:MATE family efflux transporter [Clostridia bacterium]
MKIQLSEHFTYSKLLRFTLPTIAMMIFTSIYGVVDGIFVSNFVGKTSFAAVNLIMPFLMILGTLGFMLGAGGSAIVSKTLGEGDKDRANRYFSMIVYLALICGITLSVIGWCFIRPASILLGADESMLGDCVLYGRIILIILPAFILQNIFQSFLVTAEKPHIGLALTVTAGVTNMILDFLFVAIFKWGIAGAAIATGISQIVGGVIPFVYFLRKNASTLRLTKTRFEGRVILKTCTNGSSEMLSNISMSLVSMLYNFQLMKLAGENGIAAYGVIMYINFIFTGVFFGYAIGSAPIIGYNYGAANHSELKNIFKKSLCSIAAASILLTALALILSQPLSKIFVGYDRELLALTCRGFRIYTLSFLIMGFNIFSSSFFTALNNGAISAVISFLRTLVFQVFPVLLLPVAIGTDGIWLAIVVAELFALAVSVIFFIKKKNVYHYI